MEININPSIMKYAKAVYKNLSTFSPSNIFRIATSTVEFFLCKHQFEFNVHEFNILENSMFLKANLGAGGSDQERMSFRFLTSSAIESGYGQIRTHFPCAETVNRD